MSLRMSGIRRRFGWVFAAVLGLAVAGTSGMALAQGTLVWGKPNDVDTFDVHTSTNAVTWQVLFLVYESLMEPNGDLTGFSPLIAESWDQPSPTTYIFHIRENAKFSNGRSVTATDVVKSLERLRSPDIASFWASSATISLIGPS